LRPVWAYAMRPCACVVCACFRRIACAFSHAFHVPCVQCGRMRCALTVASFAPVFVALHGPFHTLSTFLASSVGACDAALRLRRLRLFSAHCMRLFRRFSRSLRPVWGHAILPYACIVYARFRRIACAFSHAFHGPCVQFGRMLCGLALASQYASFVIDLEFLF
jgi:hypothetical protein